MNTEQDALGAMEVEVEVEVHTLRYTIRTNFGSKSFLARVSSGLLEL